VYLAARLKMGHGHKHLLQNRRPKPGEIFKLTFYFIIKFMKKSCTFFALVISTFLLISAACKKNHSDLNRSKIPNPPVARAGVDTTIYLPFTSCVLSGGASTDPDSKILFYKWRCITAPATVDIYSTIDISGNTDMEPLVSGLGKVGDYEFELTVTDLDKLSAKDTISITVIEPNNTGPGKEFIFKNLSWNYEWIMEIDIPKFFSYLPPNSYVKNIYIKRDSSNIWEFVVPQDLNSPDLGKVPEWFYGRGTLIIFPGLDHTDDTPDVKIEYSN
jgi:hypothetical protein